MNNATAIQVLEEILRENQADHNRKQQTFKSMSMAIGTYPQDYVFEITKVDLRIKALQRAIEFLKFS